MTKEQIIHDIVVDIKTRNHIIWRKFMYSDKGGIRLLKRINRITNILNDLGIKYLGQDG